MDEIEVVVNGEKVAAPVRNVEELLGHLGVPLTSTLVELNEVALHRSEWEKVLKPGDRVELLRIAAGG